jgi:hypothetical protein
LSQGKKGYQAVATDELAQALANVSGGLLGSTVTVWGRIEMVPWEKDGKSMPPFARIVIERVQTPGWTLPSGEAVPEPLFPDDDLSDMAF